MQINFFRPAKFNVHETCIPSPSPKLTGFLFIKTLHEPYSSALKKKAQFSQTFHLFQVVGVQLFHFLSLYKPRPYPPSFLVLFQLIRFHQFLVSKCFCIHDVLSQTNQHQSLSLLRLIFLHFVSASSNPSLFVKLFLFLSFFLLLVVFFSALMLCKPGFYFLFRNNVSFKTVSGESKAVTPEMVAGWNKTTLPPLLITVLRIFTTPTNSGCFINVYQTNPIS